MRHSVPLLLALVACAPADPVGSWEGTTLFVRNDQEAYVNEMTLAADGTGEVTLWSIQQVQDEDGDIVDALAWADFLADWQLVGRQAEIALACDWEDCDHAATMTCRSRGDGLSCDMTPDYYDDDRALLQWVPAGTVTPE